MSKAQERSVTKAMKGLILVNDWYTRSGKRDPELKELLTNLVRALTMNTMPKPARPAKPAPQAKPATPAAGRFLPAYDRPVRVGDVVMTAHEIIGQPRLAIGSMGVVTTEAPAKLLRYGVDFFDDILDGHDCMDTAHDGHGWFVKEGDLATIWRD